MFLKRRKTDRDISKEGGERGFSPETFTEGKFPGEEEGKGGICCLKGCLAFFQLWRLRSPATRLGVFVVLWTINPTLERSI